MKLEWNDFLWSKYLNIASLSSSTHEICHLYRSANNKSRSKQIIKYTFTEIDEPTRSFAISWIAFCGSTRTNWTSRVGAAIKKWYHVCELKKGITKMKTKD